MGLAALAWLVIVQFSAGHFAAFWTSTPSGRTKITIGKQKGWTQQPENINHKITIMITEEKTCEHFFTDRTKTQENILVLAYIEHTQKNLETIVTLKEINYWPMR